MKFKYNPRIIKQLGTELISSDGIALSELIKNSYDAKAHKVNIQFLDSINDLNKDLLVSPLPKIVEDKIKEMNANLILIEDDGLGMDSNRLQKGFFEIGSDIKQFDKNLNSSNGVILGNKGIGRLSAQRLSPILFIETASINEKGEYEIHFLKINWEEFEKQADKDAEEFIISPICNKTYTRLWLVSNSQKPINFSNYFINVVEQDKNLFGIPFGPKKTYYKINDDLLSTLSYLYSPFDSNSNPITQSLYYNKTSIKAEFNKNNLHIAEAQHSFKIKEIDITDEKLILSLRLKIQPWFIQRIHSNLVGDKLFQDYKKESGFYQSIYKKYEERFTKSLTDEVLIYDYFRKQLNKSLTEDEKKNRIEASTKYLKQILPMDGCIYSFKRDRKMLEMAYNSAITNQYIKSETKLNDIKSFLEAYNGVKLYRNGFRIAFLGNKSDDWLKLQQKRTTGQQFYRFELGNALGYVNLNDPKQEYIFETSSREDITDDKPHKKILSEILDYIFNDCFYSLTRNAVEITKDILDEEGLIPKSKKEEIENESNNAKELLESATKSLDAFTKVFKVISENKDLDSQEKIETVKLLLSEVDVLAQNLGGSIKNSTMALKTADIILTKAEEHRKRIEIESYNNYKLMANGLITEVITHELHSLIQDKDLNNYNQKIDEVKQFLFDQNNPGLYKENLYPVRKRMDSVSSKLSDIRQFYNFLEKTFVYSGKIDDFELQNLKEFLDSLAERNSQRLNRNKIKMDFENTDFDFNIPRGAFMHVFYNLVDNSIYWIGVRQSKAIYDKSFHNSEQDKITIRVVDKNVIQYFDSGIGVLDKYQYTLFQPMVSGKEQGRGMGLYIIRKFLESFDAKIELLDDLNLYGNRYIFQIIFNTQNIENN